MAVILSTSQRDKAVWALRDITKSMFGDPRRMEFKDLDELQTILAGHGLQLAPLAAVVPVPPSSAPVAVAGTPVASTALGTNEQHWLENLIASYQQYKQENRKGYVYNLDHMRRLLVMLCRLANVKFNP